MGEHMLINSLRNGLDTENSECALPPPLTMSMYILLVSIWSCFLHRSAKDNELFRCIINKNYRIMCFVHLTLIV